MSVPVLTLSLVAMIVALSMSLQDHAGQAAAYDLASARAARSAALLVQSCAAGECAQPDGFEVCAGESGLVVTASVEWSPKLWQALTPVSASRVLLYDTGFGADYWAAALVGRTSNCA